MVYSSSILLKWVYCGLILYIKSLLYRFCSIINDVLKMCSVPQSVFFYKFFYGCATGFIYQENEVFGVYISDLLINNKNMCDEKLGYNFFLIFKRKFRFKKKKSFDFTHMVIYGHHFIFFLCRNNPYLKKEVFRDGFW